MSDIERLRAVLAEIAEVAASAAGREQRGDGDDSSGDVPAPDVPGCVIRSLPSRLVVKAAQQAVTINPVNAPGAGPYPGAEGGPVIDQPLHIAVLTAKYWGPSSRELTVSFLETTAADLRTRILSHMNAWNRTAGVRFVYTQGTGQVRISRGSGGYWSYLGTDITLVPTSRPTMNLQGFTMTTSESEYRRVVRHETGHTLGFPHEHMRRAVVARIDRAKAYEYFRRTQGWDRQTVDQQVLTPLEESSLMATPADETSIMCYQLPGSITIDGKPVVGGLDINQTDYDFAGRIYPGTARAAGPAATPGLGEAAAADGDWDESEDADLVDAAGER